MKLRSYKGCFRLLKMGVYIGCLLMTSSVSSAFAEDWLWKANIPCEIKNLPHEVKYIEIRIELLRVGYQGSYLVAKKRIVKEIDPNGNFIETVPVEIYEKDLFKDKDPGMANTYVVNFMIGESTKEYSFYQPSPNAKSDPSWTGSIPGAEFVSEAKGPIESIKIKVLKLPEGIKI